MRAKITIKTNLSTNDIKARLQDDDWDVCQPGSEREEQIKAAILDTVANKDKKQADEGSLFSFEKPHTDTIGLISTESQSATKELQRHVIRIKSDNVMILQTECEKLVQVFYEYCSQIKQKTCDFVEKIVILEIKNHDTIIEGQAIPDRRQRFALARNRKKLEFIFAIVGFISLILALLITFPWPEFDNLKHDSKAWAWLFDLPNKAIGSILITAVASGLGFYFFYKDLKHDLILWSLPHRTQPIILPTSAKSNK